MIGGGGGGGSSINATVMHSMPLATAQTPLSSNFASVAAVSSLVPPIMPVVVNLIPNGAAIKQLGVASESTCYLPCKCMPLS